MNARLRAFAPGAAGGLEDLGTLDEVLVLGEAAAADDPPVVPALPEVPELADATG